MTGIDPTPATPPVLGAGATPVFPAGLGAPIVWDNLMIAELARVLRVISDYFTGRPLARESLARFAFPGLHASSACGGPYFWAEELLDFLDQAATAMADLAAAAPGGSW